MIFGIVFTKGCKFSINKQEVRSKRLKGNVTIVYTYGYEHNDSTQIGLKDQTI